jgi:O-antigen ligase
LASSKDASIIERFQDMTKPASESNNNKMRIRYWEQGVNIFLKHPVFGIGPGLIPNIDLTHLESFSEEIVHSPYAHAHNIFLTAMGESGILGLIGFLVFHAIPICLLFAHRKTPDPHLKFWICSAIFVNLQFILNGMTDNIFGVKPMMYIYWTVTAVPLWMIYNNKAPK